MQRAGGIIGLVAGIFGVLAAGVTLMIEGLESELKTDNAQDGALFSILVIVLGAVATSAKSKTSGALLTLAAITGAILGGTFVAIFMLLAVAGGILAMIGTRKAPSEATTT